MIELITPLTTALTNSFTGTAARSLKVAIPSALAWLATSSLLDGRSPGQLLQVAIEWSGLTWSVAPFFAWLQARNEAVLWLSLLLTIVVTAGLRWGIGPWLASARMLTGSVVSTLLLLEIDASRLTLIAFLSIGPLVAGFHDRSKDSAILALIGPCLLLAGPLVILAELLGYNDQQRRIRAYETSTTAARLRLSSDTPNRIRPPAFRPYPAVPPIGATTAPRLHESPPGPGSTRRRATVVPRRSSRQSG